MNVHKMDKNEIKRIVLDIQSSDIANKEEHFGEKYKEFKDRYEVFFTIACSDRKLDPKMLDYVLNMSEKVKQNDISQHDASVEVGQRLYDKYVGHKVKH